MVTKVVKAIIVSISLCCSVCNAQTPQTGGSQPFDWSSVPPAGLIGPSGIKAPDRIEKQTIKPAKATEPKRSRRLLPSQPIRSTLIPWMQKAIAPQAVKTPDARKALEPTADRHPQYKIQWQEKMPGHQLSPPATGKSNQAIVPRRADRPRVPAASFAAQSSRRQPHRPPSSGNADQRGGLNSNDSPAGSRETALAKPATRIPPPPVMHTRQLPALLTSSRNPHAIPAAQANTSAQAKSPPSFDLIPLTLRTLTQKTIPASSVSKTLSAEVRADAVVLQEFKPRDVQIQRSALDNTGGASQDLELMPFQPLITAGTKIDPAGSLTTANMTGPLAPGTQIFGKLNLEKDFREQPALIAAETRAEIDAYGIETPWMMQQYAWVNPTFAHRPLYFEQPNLERYGIGARRGLQPVLSAAHFFGVVTVLPYKMLFTTPKEPVFTLGHRRPGDCVPYQKGTFLAP